MPSTGFHGTQEFEQPEFTPATEEQLESLQRQIIRGQEVRRDEYVGSLEEQLGRVVTQLDTASGPEREALLQNGERIIKRLEAIKNGEDPVYVIDTARAKRQSLAREVVTA